MALIGAEESAGGSVPTFELAVTSAGGEGVAVGGEGEGGDVVGVAGDGGFDAAPGGFPDFDGQVGAGRDEKFTVRRKGDEIEEAVFAEDGFEAAGGDVPNVGDAFVAAGEGEVVAGEGEGDGGLLVAFEGAVESVNGVGQTSEAADFKFGCGRWRRGWRRRFDDFLGDGLWAGREAEAGGLGRVF